MNNFAQKIQNNKEAWAEFEGHTDSWVEFYQHFELNAEKTKAAGYDVYDDVDHALMVSKAGKSKVSVKATEKMRRQYPKAWEIYQRKRELQKTHLGVIGLRPSQIKDLERFEVDCVESLIDADVPDFYSKYKQAAKLIVRLRHENDREFKECRELESSQGMDGQRTQVPRNQSQQHNNIGQIRTGQSQEKQESQIRTSQDSGKIQQVNGFNFNYSLTL